MHSMQGSERLKYDVIIVGAGPAGCACALALKDSGLTVAMIDKHAFPRDKICGDAIPLRAIKTLSAIDPAFPAAFKAFPLKLETKHTSIYYKGRAITFNWVREAYLCTRLEFDYFLYSLVKAHTNTAIFTPLVPDSVTVHASGVTLSIKHTNQVFDAKLIIGADGAHSVVAKRLAPRPLDRRHHVGSVRAYFSGVAGPGKNSMDIYFEKQFLPSYLWVFPVHGGRVNVGFGMLSSEIARRKINIKNAFYEFIDRTPDLKERFRDATQVGGLEGFGLPLGSGTGIISGHRFLLAGDAAALIDPLSGEGIGNAMLSGRLAAAQAIRAIRQDDFSPVSMKQYDSALFRALGKELKNHYRLQRILSSMPFLLDAVFTAAQSKLIKNMMQKVF
jgi:geranylgeranyl reductase family protein